MCCAKSAVVVLPASLARAALPPGRPSPPQLTRDDEPGKGTGSPGSTGPGCPLGGACGEAVVQGSVPAAGAGDPDGLADGLGGSDEDDEFLCPGDRGVQQVP